MIPFLEKWLEKRRRRSDDASHPPQSSWDTEAVTIIDDPSFGSPPSDQDIDQAAEDLRAQYAVRNRGNKASGKEVPDGPNTLNESSGKPESSTGGSIHENIPGRRSKMMKPKGYRRNRDLKTAAFIILLVMAMIALVWFGANRNKSSVALSEEPMVLSQSQNIETSEGVAVPPDPGPQPEAANDNPTYYTTKPGDAMYRKFGPEGTLKVQAANPEIIKHINLLPVGVTLVIPEGVTVLEAPAFRVVDCSKLRKGFCEYRHPGGDKMRGKRDQREALLAEAEYGLNEADADLVLGTTGKRVLLPAGTEVSDLSFGRGHWKGPIRLMVPMWATEKATIDGMLYLEFEVCGNLARMKAPVVLQEPEPEIIIPDEPEPEVQEPAVIDEPQELPTAEPSPEPEAPALSVFPSENEFEYEAIVGAGVWDNKLAHGTWQYGEAALALKLRDGYAVGAGIFGMRGEGESDTSDYTWKESSGIGPQLVLKRNYRKEQQDEFDQTVLLPAGWTMKARFLDNDKVSGGVPGGYNMTQRGGKIGLYGEYYERRSLDWLYGVNAEKWWYSADSIQSTWSGDKPQDRGSWNANVYAQYRINDDWQARGIAGVSHQNWDLLNFLNLSAEARYKETIMFGPRLSLALNKPETYRDMSRGDLTTFGAFIRAEFGEVIRKADREAREASVVSVGTVAEQTEADQTAADQPADGENSPVVPEAPMEAEETDEPLEAVASAEEHAVESSWVPDAESLQ